jgi:hypothetical protein
LRPVQYDGETRSRTSLQGDFHVGSQSADLSIVQAHFMRFNLLPEDVTFEVNQNDPLYIVQGNRVTLFGQQNTTRWRPCYPGDEALPGVVVCVQV